MASQETKSQNADHKSAAKKADIRTNPHIFDDEARNAAAGEGPTGAGGVETPSTVDEHVPSSSEPVATDLPSANAPDPDAAGPDNPNASRREK